MSFIFNEKDATSTTDSTNYTPCSGLTTIDSLRDDRSDAVPWPGNTYMILEKDSGRAITIANGRLCVQHVNNDLNRSCYWLCVEADGYFGFFNQKLGEYMGHHGERDVDVFAEEFGGSEYFTPRRHPDGGYQLLTPVNHNMFRRMTIAGGEVNHNMLRQVAIASDDKRLVRRQHAGTCWEFVKVSDHK